MMWQAIFSTIKGLFGGSGSRRDFNVIATHYEKLASDLRGELDQVRDESRECQEREKKMRRAVRKKIGKMKLEFNAMRKADLERIGALEKEVVRLQKQADEE